MNTDQSDGRSHYELSSCRKKWWWGSKMVSRFYHYLLVPLLSTSNNSKRSSLAPDLTLPTYNLIGGVHWVSARGTARQFCFLHGSILNYTERGRLNWSTASCHTILRLIWVLFRRQYGRGFSAHKPTGRTKICHLKAIAMTMTTPLLSHAQWKNGSKGS